VNGDCDSEGNETFVVNLSGAVNAVISDNQGSGTITDDEASGGLSIADLTVSEPSTGSANAVFTVSLANGCVGLPVSVSYDVSAGSAIAGPLGTGDFSSVSGTLTISLPATTGTILVPIHSDNLLEPQETFFVNLFSPVNATIVDDRATGTIADPPANFFTLTPCRVADTRGPSGPFGGPALVANTARDFQVTGQCGVPATAKAVAINVTIVDPDNSGDLRIYPAGMAQPPVSSTIVFGPNQVRANNAVMPLSATGQMTVFCDMPSGSTNFVFDVFGYFE
ncbi:MAG: Calx-beta domain-containing protein, partial [Thermoanaerobaculia bacterium]